MTNEKSKMIYGKCSLPLPLPSALCHLPLPSSPALLDKPFPHGIKAPYKPTENLPSTSQSYSRPQVTFP